MSANAAEWVMAFSTLLTGGFVGWQSWSINESLNSQLAANSHQQVSEICLEFIPAVANYSREFENVQWGGWADGPYHAQVSDSDFGDGGYDYLSHFRDAEKKLQQTAIRVYLFDPSSGGDAQNKFVDALYQATSKGWPLADSFAGDRKARTEARTEAKQALDKLAIDLVERCKSVVLGEEKGIW